MNARIANRAAKKTIDSKNKRKLYINKSENIIKAVQIIEDTETKAVEYILDFDPDKNMYFITFNFNKKEDYMKVDSVCFHILINTYNKIKDLQLK